MTTKRAISLLKNVMWVGRATTFLVGLAVILALMFGVATASLAGTGAGGDLQSGHEEHGQRHNGSLLLMGIEVEPLSAEHSLKQLL
jgi:hypothetical protein